MTNPSALEQTYPLLLDLEEFLKEEFPKKIEAKKKSLIPTPNCLSSFVNPDVEATQARECLLVIAKIKEQGQLPEAKNKQESKFYQDNQGIAESLKLPICVLEALPQCCLLRMKDLSTYLENFMDSDFFQKRKQPGMPILMNNSMNDKPGKKLPCMTLKQVLETKPQELKNLSELYDYLAAGNSGYTVDGIKNLTQERAEKAMEEWQNERTSNYVLSPPSP